VITTTEIKNAPKARIFVAHYEIALSMAGFYCTPKNKGEAFTQTQRTNWTTENIEPDCPGLHPFCYWAFGTGQYLNAIPSCDSSNRVKKTLS